MKKITQNIPVFLYPGYFWSYYEGAQCIFSEKTCNNDGIWTGVYTYGQWQRSAGISI